MWFMKYFVNPLVRLILSSPLHGLFSASTLLITVRGRKSGKVITLPVQYAEEGDSLYILPGNPEKKTWWRNLRGGADVQVRLRGESLSGKADLLEGAADPAALVPALNAYLTRFPPSAGMHGVQHLPDGAFDPADLLRAAGSLRLVRVRLSR